MVKLPQSNSGIPKVGNTKRIARGLISHRLVALIYQFKLRLTAGRREPMCPTSSYLLLSDATNVWLQTAITCQQFQIFFFQVMAPHRPFTLLYTTAGLIGLCYCYIPVGVDFSGGEGWLNKCVNCC